MIAIVDTHVLLWWFERAARLSRAQSRVLARADAKHPLGVADITLWEIAMLVELGRIRLALSIDEWLARATAPPLVQVCAITPAIAREMIEVRATRTWDPADRIVVATARTLGVPLVTSDARIVEAGVVDVVE